PSPGVTLPSSSRIATALAQGTFKTFVDSLNGPHNRVHDWCFGTMSDISWSSVDPLFWLHHAEIDRIWSKWQAKHPKRHPALSGTDAIMDPWPETEEQL